MAAEKSTKLCECGCGEYTRIATRTRRRSDGSVVIKKGDAARFIEHHAARVAAAANKSHGLSKSPTWSSWLGMVQRVTKPEHQAFHNYGGRGIDMDPRWLKFSAFLEDMGERPPGLTLDRRDNDAGYWKHNCRWISVHEQHANRRDNVTLTFNGKTQHIAAWDREIFGRRVIGQRLKKGWSVQDALTLPPDRSRRNRHC